MAIVEYLEGCERRLVVFLFRETATWGVWVCCQVRQGLIIGIPGKGRADDCIREGEWR
jgi:hypothetical protein